MAQAEHDLRVDYVEFGATDIKRTRRFYERVFGWRFEDYGPDYTSFQDGRLSGGFTRDAPVRPANPLIVIYAARLEQVSAGAIQLNMGTLYPALMRLEQRGLLRGKWSTTESNRRARLYSLTAAGRRELVKEKQAWDRMAAIMHALLRGSA